MLLKSVHFAFCWIEEKKRYATDAGSGGGAKYEVCSSLMQFLSCAITESAISGSMINENPLEISFYKKIHPAKISWIEIGE